MKTNKFEDVELQTIDSMVEKVKLLPIENFYYEGIKENSFNLLIAQAKVGKTTYAENIAMCIAAGYKNYLNKPIWFGDNRRVLIISLEEFFRGRTNRNAQQLNYMDKLVGNKDWHENIFVLPENAPRYIESQADWDWLLSYIKQAKPAFTVIDSLSRMHGSEAIEDSSTCIKLMKQLRNIVEEAETTLLVIHHTSKIGNDPLTLSNMAGSRIISQEADAIIALNKTPTGKRYIKALAYRYADDSCEKVQLFTRDNNQWLQPGGLESEYKILREFDNRVDDTNSEKLMDYILDFTAGDNSIIVETKAMLEHFVETGEMSKPTMHKGLFKLIENNTLSKHGKGKYTLLQK